MKSEAIKNNQQWMKSTEPILNGLLNNWELIPVEGRDNTVCRILSKVCGIDYLLCSDTAVYGVISYVDYGENTRTFTVNIENIVEDNSLSPYYTMKVYVKDDKIIGLGLVKTEDLIDFIESGFASVRNTEYEKSYVCHWDDMELAGYDVKEYRVEQPVSDNKTEGKTAHHGEKPEHNACSCKTYDMSEIYKMCDDVISKLGKNKGSNCPF